MRPSRILALPLVLLALLLQAGAGIAATRAQAEAANPFAAIPVCSPDKPGHTGQGPAGEHGDHHCAACLVGAAAQPGLLASATPLVPGGLEAVANAAPPRYAAPRGPPSRAPKARGPPLFA
jgi:hypothetical protein